MADTTTLATVEFHGAHLVTTLVDGEPHVALRPICEAVGLGWNGQYERLMRHAVLAPTIRMTRTVAEDGKLREMATLPLKMLNGWLLGVDASRVNPDVQERLLDYQRECFDVLASYWQMGAALNPRQTAQTAMIGQSTGLPTAQLVALQVQGWKIVDRLKAEQVPELRRDLYEQLQRVYADLGQTPPPLAAIGREAPAQHPQVTAFWAAYRALADAGVALNHAHNGALIAINLNQLFQAAAGRGMHLADHAALKRALRESREPRFIDVRTVNSAILGHSIHCWLFEVREGGAA